MHPSTPTSTRLALLLCAASAVLYFLTFVNFTLYPLIWICFVPVLVAIRNTSFRRALALGTVFGAITNLGGYYWVIHTIQAFGNLPFVVAVLGYMLLCAYQGFLLAIVVALVRYGEQRLTIAPLWSLAVVFPAIEFCYPLLFPSYIGNSQLYFTTITQFVDITGMAGLTALIGMVNGAFYEIAESRLQRRPVQRWRIIVPSVVFAACGLYGLVRLQGIDTTITSAPKLTVGIVQTNIGERDKAADPERFILEHQTMSRDLVIEHPDLDLIVWPESVFSEGLPRSQTNVRFNVMRGIDRPLLFGALTYERDASGRVANFYNSMLVAAPSGDIMSTYDKIDLLAFGETYPFSESLPFLESIFGTNWFTRGTSLEHLRVGDTSLLPTICFEDVSPSLVRRVWQAGGPADALVNGTNDSWYGDTIEPMEHLALAAFRSIETRRALIRSTNTGISAIVDPAGRITHRTGQWQKATLVAQVPLIKDGSTTIFMKLGNVLGWTCVILTLVGLWKARASRREEPRNDAKKNG